MDGGAVVVPEPLDELDELDDPGEETVCEPLQELEYWTGFCGCGKSPQ